MRSLQIPGSSYRLQFGTPLGFADARLLVPYLEALGVTTCYASPLLQAAPGSAHGYDICDHDRLNHDLGSDREFDAFAAALREQGMGLILDFVPNHMGLDASANRWWHDVLQHGMSSLYAEYFDIDWDPITPELKGRLLLPILQDGYGEVLHRGELTLSFEDGRFHVQYFGRRLPTEPRSTMAVLRATSSSADQIAASEKHAWREYLDILALLADMPPVSARDDAHRARRQEITGLVRQRLAALVDGSPSIRAHLQSSVAGFNGAPGEPATFDRLHALLEQQPYRLAHWKTAFDEINYRRFFDVNDLGAIRMEEPKVFAASHKRILQLIAEYKITGLRIDHPDGLLDPASYFSRLERAIGEALSENGNDPAHGGVPILAEKILGHGELIPDSWPIAGTTGYGFLNAVNGLFINPASEETLRRLYARTTGRRDALSEVAYHSKRLVMRSSLASEVGVLTRFLKAIAGSDRRTRDFTLTTLGRAIVEVIACLPVYRTYVSASGFSATDRQTIDLAIDRAQRRNPVIAHSVFLFLRSVLLAEGDERDARIQSHRQFAMKFQQLSAPVQAKGLEDTCFYRYNVLLSLNEVGGDPSRFGESVEDFHDGNRVRLERWPREMITTATHDTKRGEDARARLNVLSEMPAQWQRAISAWRKINAPHRTAVDRKSAPDPNDEYLFYQTLVSVWPSEPHAAPIPTEASPTLVARLQIYMQKAIKEAKTHTSWFNQNAPYEDAVSRFVSTTLSGPGARGFLSMFVPFVRRVAMAGMMNSLSQLVLKIASPGIPDFYQGTETWQLDMADPDNRRPVDFASREAMLHELMPWVMRAEADSAARGITPGGNAALEQYVGALLADWSDGRIKMFLTACGLRLRRRRPTLFITANYEPLRGQGVLADHVVAFARWHDPGVLIAAVPRLMSQDAVADLRMPIGQDVWKDTRVLLPTQLSGVTFRDLFTGALLGPVGTDGYLAAADIFRTCPVSLLVSSNAGPTFTSGEVAGALRGPS